MVRRADTLPDLALSRAVLDRSGVERRDAGLVERLLADPATRVLELHGDRAPVEGEPNVRSTEPGELRLRLRAPTAEDSGRLVLFAGRDVEGTAYLGVALPRRGAGPDRSQSCSTARPRGLADPAAGLCCSGDRDARLSTTVLALANWHGMHTHCSRCGIPTSPAEGGWLRVCPADHSEHYPRTDPAVIMAVVDADERLLLGRGPQWPDNRFSVLAGFVEPGESLEAAVAREVEEEVGIDVTDIRYLGNQPWPFPSSVMIGFTSRALGTSIELDPHELSEAKWVTRDDYRTALRTGAIHRPSGLSIAKRIIEHWLGQTIESVVSDPEG